MSNLLFSEMKHCQRSFLYDGTFPGLLCTFIILLQNKEVPLEIEPIHSYAPGIFSQTVTIETESKIAQNMLKKIISRIGRDSLQNILYCFLSLQPSRELLIFSYLVIGLQKGAAVNQFLSHDDVRNLLSLKKKVATESHRFKGLIRFKRINSNIFYGPFEPLYHIISIIAPHFKKRLPAQQWILHDKKHNAALFYNGSDLQQIDISEKLDQIIRDSENDLYEKLWQKYFSSIAIKERANKKLQMQFMPKRYWKYLTESFSLQLSKQKV